MASLSPKEIALLTGQAPKSLRDEVDQVISNCLDKLNVHLPPDKVITPPVVSFDLRGTTAGQAYYRPKDKEVGIRLNLGLFLKNEEAKSYMLTVTIPHEMAHVAEYQIWGEAGHGSRWRYMMNLLGIHNPERTHNLPVTKTRIHPRDYLFRCTYCNKRFRLTKHRYNKFMRGTNYRCNDCNGELEFVGKVGE